MGLTIPTLDEVTDRVIEDYRARFPDDDLSPHGDNWKSCRTRAMAAWSVMQKVRRADKSKLATDADGDDLDELGEVVEIPRKGATGARKSDALRLVGTSASPFLEGERLTSAAGLIYELGEGGLIPAGGQIDVDVRAVSTGSATRLKAGEVLTFVTPPSGINADAELQLDLDEDGEDRESHGAYRNRLLTHERQPGMGGNANDFVVWALEVTGIASAYVYPLRRGLGTVDLAALHTGRGSVRVLSGAEEAELETYIEDRRPVAMLLFRVLSVTTDAVDCDVQVKALPGYDWDWNDTAGPKVVSSWEPGGAERTLRLTTDRPTDMKAGDRIVIQTAAGDGTGQQYVVEDLPATLTDLVLTETPAPAPASTDSVYSGGDLVDPVRDAVLAFFDALGPAIGTTGTGEWIDEVDPTHLLAIALQQTGVRNGQVNTPAATVVPDDTEWPADTSVELLVPGEIVVRRLP